MRTRSPTLTAAAGGVTLILLAESLTGLGSGTRHSGPAASVGGAGTTAATLAGQLPPLIDRGLFFSDPEITNVQILSDGHHVAFVKPFRGTRNIWVKRVDEPFEKARPVTADTERPILNYFGTWDGKHLLYLQDQGGDENFNVHAVDVSAPAPPDRDVSPARNITRMKGVRTRIFAMPKSEPDAIYLGLNDRDKAWHDLYKVSISTGERTLLAKNTERVTSWWLDRDDHVRLAWRWAENGDYEFLRVDGPDKYTKIYSCDLFETCYPLRFHKDGRRVYINTNRGEGDLQRLALLDIRTGEEELVETDPLNRADLSWVHFSRKTGDLLGTVYEDDRPRLYWRDNEFEADYRLLKEKFADKEVSFEFPGSLDERRFIVAVMSDVEPGETYLFDRDTKAVALQYRTRENLPRQGLAPKKAITYASSDGLQIPAFLTLPKGLPAKDLPLVVLPHGGPHAQDTFYYSAVTQFLANRGYAVLSPNFRGSTGCGKRFLNAGNGQWGDKMQDDLTWGVKHLVSLGIANPKRVGIMGGSYGGYAALAGVTFTPDLYAAAVSQMGPSNLITMMESFPPYWAPARKRWAVRLGDPSTPEGKAQLERQSPLNHVAKIKTPVLVVHGANDPRVKKHESDQIIVALRDRGLSVEYIVASDEGHEFLHPINSLTMYAVVEKFLAKHLGGRYQASMTPEVAARLKEITVDPKTVTLGSEAGRR
jgi:dipeptidyl aminopeptidase/acylaminoacyl peptidase